MKETTIMDLRTERFDAYPDINEELLAEIARRIRSVGDPLKIVLFGSRARGDHRPDSDIDILFIEENANSLKEKSITYRAALSGMFPDETIIVHSHQDVEDWKNVPAYITTVALAQGKVIYERADYAELLGQHNSTGLVAESFGRRTSADLARSWFEKGNGDIATAKDVLEKEHCYDNICLHAQQAVEKYLKGFLALHEVVPPKTHMLEDLARCCQKLKPIPKLEEIDLELLTPYAVSARYDLYFDPPIEKAKEALTIAERVVSIILEQVPSQARPQHL